MVGLASVKTAINTLVASKEASNARERAGLPKHLIRCLHRTPRGSGTSVFATGIARL
jgi:hypothetical protein